MSVTHTRNAEPASSVALITPENYRFLQQEVYRESGIVVDADKHYLLEARLTPLLRTNSQPTLDALCTNMRQRLIPGLTQQVMEALTTNETLFFRDMAPFEAMQLRLLPELRETLGAQGDIRIWSAAASSGQEAYSIAMLLREQMEQSRKFTILGTDISGQILQVAREAKYVQFEVNRGLPALYLVKYFIQVGGAWQLKDDIRKTVTFRQFDLRQSMKSLGSFHIIFCRNVLIYFDVETKLKILDQLWMTLEPGGYLILGSAESVLQHHDRFERISFNGTSLYRKR